MVTYEMVDVLENFKNVNLYEWFIVLVAIVLACQFLYKTFIEGIIQKHGIETKGMRQKREDRELLIKTSQNLALLQEKHETDTKESIRHDKIIKEDLISFMDEMKNEIKQFTNNRIHDREQSLQIQKELTDSIKNLADANSTKDKQIDNLMVAQREVLADRINAKYKYYISIKGIPEDEYDEFVNLHTAYKGCGGNSSGDAKFEYCINHLPVISVETKLIIKHEE